MGSAAEGYAERRHEEEVARRQERLTRQHDALLTIFRGPGFGPTGRDALWVEQQIHDHLEAAMRLIDLARK